MCNLVHSPLRMGINIMLPLDFGTLTDMDTLWERVKSTKIKLLSSASLSHLSYLYFMLKDKTSKT